MSDCWNSYWINFIKDGAPLTNSNTISIWPVLAKIVELPESIAESFENLIIIGLWIDTDKPPPLYISKCVEIITDAKFKLNSEGWKHSSFNTSQYSFNTSQHTIVLFLFLENNISLRFQSFVADLPAKASFLNIMQFNGYFGCLTCVHPGEYSQSCDKIIFKPQEQPVI